MMMKKNNHKLSHVSHLQNHKYASVQIFRLNLFLSAFFFPPLVALLVVLMPVEIPLSQLLQQLA